MKRFEGRIWYNGEFEGKIQYMHWADGIFIDGIIKNVEWHNGEFLKGSFVYSKWHDGVFHDGTFKNSEWLGGEFIKGEMINSSWRDGVWRKGSFSGGNFYKGIWEDGVFLNGIFNINGIWKKGYFTGGTFRGIWKDGYWQNGKWEGIGWEKGYILDIHRVGNFEKDWEWNGDFVLSKIDPYSYFIKDSSEEKTKKYVNFKLEGWDELVIDAKIAEAFLKHEKSKDNDFITDTSRGIIFEYFPEESL